MAATEVQQAGSVLPVSSEEMTEEKLASLPPELLIKHQLQNTWTLWYFENVKTRAWEDNQVEIITFNTVEDFWAAYNYLEPSSNLRVGTDYSLFKQGIKPMWEDSRNKMGGRWVINMERSRGQRQENLDVYWLDVMLLLIGEGFGDHGSTVNGAVVNIRGKADKLALWTSDARDGSAVIGVGQRLKETLHMPPKMAIGFQAHSESQVKNSSSVKNRYTV